MFATYTDLVYDILKQLPMHTLGMPGESSLIRASEDFSADLWNLLNA